MEKKIAIGMAIAFLLIIAVMAAAYSFFTPQDVQNVDKPVACTAEAKQCPDGSYVGRTGPACEFAECEGVMEPEISKSGDLSGDSNVGKNNPTQETEQEYPDFEGKNRARAIAHSNLVKLNSNAEEWKIYTDQEYKFNFKYPKALTYEAGELGELERIHLDSADGSLPKTSYRDHLSAKIITQSLDEIVFNPRNGGGETYVYNREEGIWRGKVCPECSEYLSDYGPRQYTTALGYTVHFVQTGNVCIGFERAMIESPRRDFIVEILTSRRGQSVGECVSSDDPVPFTDENTIFLILDTFSFGD